MSHLFGYIVSHTDPQPAIQARFQDVVLRFFARSDFFTPQIHSFRDGWLAMLHSADGRGCDINIDSCGVNASVGVFLDRNSSQKKPNWITHAEQLERFAGQFGYVQFNDETKELLLATDHFGIRGLYYACYLNFVLFSTSFVLLKKCLGNDSVIDQQGFAEKMFFGFSLSDRTTSKYIKKIQPGCYIKFDSNQVPTSGQYINLYNESTLPLSFDGHLDRVKTAFSQSVSRCRTGTIEECFLSGGMDSRAIVAELFNQSADIRTFCSGYENSADHILSSAVASKFGTRHYFHARTPAQRVKYSQDPFALYAKEHFPSEKTGVRHIWSGDGGGLIGNIQLSEEKIDVCSGSFSEFSARQLYSKLNVRFTKLFTDAELREFSSLAVQGLVDEFASLSSVSEENRFRVFYLKNHQSRHLVDHYETIDLHQTELVLPFFDADLVKSVLQVPSKFLLRHRFYNRWLGTVSTLATSVYWQAYPGHDSSSLPRPSTIKDQWDKDWYTSTEVNSAYVHIATSLLKGPLYPERWRTYLVLSLAAAFAYCGSSRLRHEITLARTLRLNFT